MSDYLKNSDSLFVRIGLFKRPDDPSSGYGRRASIPLQGLTKKLPKLSLIIPSFTDRGDIHSGKGAYLNVVGDSYVFLRSLHAFDLDASEEECKLICGGRKPLFTDSPATTYKNAKAVKLAVGKRAREEGTLRKLVAVCPWIERVAAATKHLVDQLNVHGVQFVAFFSGGKGFRVLVIQNALFVRALWGQEYQKSAVERVLAFLKDTLGCNVDMIAPHIDHSVYGTEAGVKSDLLAHNDTGLFPIDFTDSWDSGLDTPIGKETANPQLCARIRRFWTWVAGEVPKCFASAPLIRVAAPKPKKRKFAAMNVSASYNFPKATSYSVASHFELKGKFTSYRLVGHEDTAKLYDMLAIDAANGKTFVTHEVAEPICCFHLDYDGGPELFGDLQVLKSIQQSLNEAFDGSLDPKDLEVAVALRKSDNETGVHAHLYWPKLGVALEDGERVTHFLAKQMKTKYPDLQVNWATVLDPQIWRGVPSLRMLGADQWVEDSECEQYSGLKYALDGIFDANGEKVDIQVTFRQALDYTSLRSFPASTAPLVLCNEVAAIEVSPAAANECQRIPNSAEMRNVLEDGMKGLFDPSEGNWASNALEWKAASVHQQARV